jgi:hypothetical protein
MHQQDVLNVRRAYFAGRRLATGEDAGHHLLQMPVLLLDDPAHLLLLWRLRRLILLVVVYAVNARFPSLGLISGAESFFGDVFP